MQEEKNTIQTTKPKKNMTVKRLMTAYRKKLGLRLKYGRNRLERLITVVNLNRPGLAIAGHLELFRHERIQIIGQGELGYCRKANKEKLRENFDKMFENGKVPCVIISGGIKKPPEVLLEIIQEFMATIQERFGSHVHVLDWSLHLDETSPHIHARQVFDIENRYGEIEPKQEKALEALGIPLPFPEKKPGRQNSRKITFDSICRELLLNICEEHGLEVERDAIYGGRENREKNDYIIQAQRERIAELEQRNAELTADNEAQSRIIAQKSAELDEKMEKLADADTVLEAVADTAYREAVKVVAAEAIRETQEQDLMVLEKGRQQVMSPETKMKQKDRELVADWFVRAASTLKKRAKSILEKVIEALRLPATRDAAKAKIKEQAKPSIIELLQNYKQKSQELQAQKPRQHSWEER